MENIHNGKLNEGVKTVIEIVRSSKNEPILASCHMEDGKLVKTKFIHEIDDVKVIGDGKVVMVSFADGTTEKAVLANNDTFSLEQGISICITKKILSYQSNGNGSNLYNKIIDRAMKKYKKIQKDKKKAEEQKKAAEAKYQKTVAKKAAKRAKREAAAREAQIEIQKEAYLRAMQEFNNASEEQK